MKNKDGACRSVGFCSTQHLWVCGGAEVKQSRQGGFQAWEQRRTWKEELPEISSCRNRIRENVSRMEMGATLCCQAWTKMKSQWRTGEEAVGGGGGKNNELKHSHLCWQNNLLHSIFSQPQLFLHSHSTVIALRSVWKKQRNYFVVALFLMICYPFVFIGHPCPGAFGHITKYN